MHAQPREHEMELLSQENLILTMKPLTIEIIQIIALRQTSRQTIIAVTTTRVYVYF